MAEFIKYLLDSYNFWMSIILMMIGFYIVINSGNLIKKLIGLSVFQTSVLLFYISASFVKDAAIPILSDGVHFYVNPLPHVLMLTAIVVGLAILSVGLAIASRIKEEYGTIEEEDILREDMKLIKKLNLPSEQKKGPSNKSKTPSKAKKK